MPVKTKSVQRKICTIYTLFAMTLLVVFCVKYGISKPINIVVVFELAASMIFFIICTISTKCRDNIHGLIFLIMDIIIMSFMLFVVSDTKYLHIGILTEMIALCLYKSDFIIGWYYIFSIAYYIVVLIVYMGRGLLSGIGITYYIAAAATIVCCETIIRNLIFNANKYARIMEENSKSSHDMMKVVLMKRQEAETATRAKTLFLSNMSHEIRTPINAILGIDEIIRRESKEQNIIEYAGKIKNAGDTLLSLINDILDFSKIEAGKMVITEDTYDTERLLNDIYNINIVKAEQKDLEFKIEAAPDLPSALYGDALRVKQIILNIMSNAIKYTERGFVRLKVNWERINKDMINLMITVSDSGIGIKKENIERLFSSFDRINENGVHHIEGTGLGMTITKSLVQLFNGQISVESEPGVGSTFLVSLPQKIVSDEGIGRFVPNIADTYKEEKYEESLVAPNARVLVVDDNQLNILVVEGLLTRTKVQIDTALSGKECLELVQKNKYDIILMDHMMPDMDGIETFRNMLKLDNNMSADAAVIALTANVVNGARDMYVSHGFDDYLPKPVDSRKLEEILLKYLPEKLVSLKVKKSDEHTEKTVLTKNSLIDREEAMLYFGNDEKLMNEVIHDFYVDAKNVRERLFDFMHAGRWDDYIIEVHSLKSISKTIGAKSLADIAYSHEKAGKKGDTRFITDNWDKLCDTWDMVLNEIECGVSTERESFTDSEALSLSGNHYKIYMDELILNIRKKEQRISEELIDDILLYNIDETSRKKLVDAKKFLSNSDFDNALEVLRDYE